MTNLPWWLLWWWLPLPLVLVLGSVFDKPTLHYLGAVWFFGGMLVYVVGLFVKRSTRKNKS